MRTALRLLGRLLLAVLDYFAPPGRLRNGDDDLPQAPLYLVDEYSWFGLYGPPEADPVETLGEAKDD